MKNRLIAAAIALPLLGGCDTLENWSEPQLTPEEQTQMDAYEASMGDLEAEISSLTDLAETAIKNGNMVAFKVIGEDLQTALDAHVEAATAAGNLLKEAKDSKMTGFMGLVSKIPGPWQPFIPLLGGALTTLLGKRSRRFAWITVRDSLKVGVAKTVLNAGRALGMAHSSEASKEAAVSDSTSPITA